MAVYTAEGYDTTELSKFEVEEFVSSKPVEISKIWMDIDSIWDEDYDNDFVDVVTRNQWMSGQDLCYQEEGDVEEEYWGLSHDSIQYLLGITSHYEVADGTFFDITKFATKIW